MCKAGFALAMLAGIAPAAARAQEPRMRLVLLGVGTPNADPDRSGPATAVVVDDRAYLVDAGAGRGAARGAGRARPGHRGARARPARPGLPHAPALRPHGRAARPAPHALGARPARTRSTCRPARHGRDDGAHRAKRGSRTSPSAATGSSPATPTATPTAPSCARSSPASSTRTTW